MAYGDSDAVILEEKIKLLLGKLTDDLGVWQEITKTAAVADIFVGLFIDKWNEEFVLTPSIIGKISDRNLEIVFDIYSPTESWESEKDQDESSGEQR